MSTIAIMFRYAVQLNELYSQYRYAGEVTPTSRLDSTVTGSPDDATSVVSSPEKVKRVAGATT